MKTPPPQKHGMGSAAKHLPAMCRRVVLGMGVGCGLLMTNTPANAKIWHVAATGVDATADGSFAKPWKTVQMAVDEAQPGDTVLLGPGVYKQRISINEPGNAEKGYITLLGEDGAIISGEGQTSEAAIFMENQSFIRISNLTITANKSDEESYGILIQGGGTNLEVLNCKFTKLLGRSAVGIAFYGSDSKRALQKLKVDGCEITHCQPAPSEALVLNGNVEDFEVTNNVITDVNNIAIDFIGGERGVMKDPTKVCRNGICRGNRVERARSTYEDGYAAGIYVDGGKDIVIEDNSITQCDMGIEIGAENKGTIVTGIVVQKNSVFRNDKAGIAIGGFDESKGRVKDCRVVGNVFYKNTQGKVHQAELWLQQGSNNEISGNSFWVRDETLMVAADPGGMQNKIDNNTWWCDAGAEKVLWMWASDTLRGFEGYRMASGQDALSKFTKPNHPAPEKGQFQFPLVSIN